MMFDVSMQQKEKYSNISPARNDDLELLLSLRLLIVDIVEYLLLASEIIVRGEKITSTKDSIEL